MLDTRSISSHSARSVVGGSLTSKVRTMLSGTTFACKEKFQGRDWPGFPLEALSGCRMPHLPARDQARSRAKASAPPFNRHFDQQMSLESSGLLQPVIKHLVDHFSCFLSGCSLNKSEKKHYIFCSKSKTLRWMFWIRQLEGWHHLDPWPGAPGICTSNQYSFLSP